MDTVRPGGAINRRTLLAGSVATVLLGGVGVNRADAATTAGPATVSSLTKSDPFYIAHRGGGRNWPAMTAYAYEQASKIPNLTALEISVCITADGVLVCSHNPTTTDMTGVPYTIANETWDTLSSLMVSPKYTLDPKQPSRPFTRFDEVVDRYSDDFVLFVEPKVSAAAAPLMARMAGLKQPERVVWKQPINSWRFWPAKKRGFSTWGYVLDEPAHTGDNLLRYAASGDIDMLGAYNATSDELISQVVEAAGAEGKQSIMWEIKTLAQRERALSLGCAGLMTSNVVGVVNAPL
ncbi:MAG: glycerophosphodiester phosphodiesterase [Propionibacteriaceae bacterium]